VSEHLKGHLKKEPYTGHPEQAFKSLLRKRNVTGERVTSRVKQKSTGFTDT